MWTFAAYVRQAIVEFGGRVHYLGAYGSVKSQKRYDDLIEEWQSKGRPAAGITLTLVQPPADEDEPREPLIVEMVDRFWAYAEERYVKYGRRTPP